MVNGIFDLFDATDQTIRTHMTILRMPGAVKLGLLGVIGVALVPQRFVRPVLLSTAGVVLWFFAGLPFLAGVLSGICLVFFVTRLSWRWSRRSSSARGPLAVGWIVIHAAYLPCFLIRLPYVPDMQLGELTQLFGVSFLLLKSLHYLGRSCRGEIDPTGPGAFGRFLLYMIHIPTFRLGPYQPFAEFDAQVDTCKTRVTWRNAAWGGRRVLIGLLKLFLLLMVIERPIFAPYGRSIPFGEGMFDAAATESAGRLWLMAWLYMIRGYLFLSGMSDGAIGMQAVMGMRMPENFRWPLSSSNMIDFWRRWHISAGSWMRDEIYKPLGGVKVPRPLLYLAVFSYCGLWHYAFFWGWVMFGVLQAVVMTATWAWLAFWERERALDSPRYRRARRWQVVDSVPSRVVGTCFVLTVFAISNVLVFDHVHSGLPMLAGMFGLRG